MTLEQFRQLAETWGGNIDRWPAAMQDAAREMAADEQAAGILDEQLRLDRLFSLAPKVDEGRAGRAGFAVLQRMADADRKLPWYRRGLRPSSLFPATSLVCSALVGLWLAGRASVPPWGHRMPWQWSAWSSIVPPFPLGGLQ